MIKSWKTYLAQTEQMELQLSDSTYYKILRLIRPSIRTSVHGLDYKTNAGLECFEKLADMLRKLKEHEVIDDEQFETYKERLLYGKSYLRGDYKYHAKMTSPVADHCRTFALSDSEDPKFQVTCNHNHDQVCQNCQIIKNTLEVIQNLVAEANVLDAREKDLMQNDFQRCLTNIEEMKNHRLRAIHQQQAKIDILDNLQPNQALLIADFAMKFLPTAGREDQTSWFGKKGISWHIFYAIRKNPQTNQFQYRIFQHMFSKQVSQDSVAVTALINDTLKRLTLEWTELNELFIRSDNAGAYHSAMTLAAVQALLKEQQIKILQWDFSEPQDGKM